MREFHPQSWTGWMVRPLRHYADFRGRSGRREFWWYCLFLFVGYVAIALFAAALSGAKTWSDSTAATLLIGWGAFFLANFIPGLALSARRFHDLGFSGAVLFAVVLALVFTTVVGWLGYMVVMSLPGSSKTNRWGPPLDAPAVAEVFG